jgi:hypothetical protein
MMMEWIRIIVMRAAAAGVAAAAGCMEGFVVAASAHESLIAQIQEQKEHGLE